MHTVTDAFNAACSAPGREITSKVNFNGTTDLPAPEIQEIVITEQFGSSEGVTIGAAFSSQCKVVIYKQTPALPLYGGNFIPYAGIMVDGAAQFVPKGKFYIPSDGVEKTGDLWLTITGYDRMAGLTAEYVPTILFPATPTQMLVDVCTQAHVTAPSVTMPDIQIATPYSGSLRQQLGWLAGLIGCNAKFDDTGNLVFCWYADNGLTLGWDVQYMDGLELTADGAFTINSLLTGTEENPISVGTGLGITSTNPYMTAEQAAVVLAQISGKSLMPCKLKWRGNPAVEAGDSVTVTGRDGKALTVYVMEQRMTIKGGMSADITCYGPEDAEYAVESPTQKKVQQQYNDVRKAFRDATERIIGAKGGYFEITYDDDGFPTGWVIRNTPSVEDDTKMWIMSAGGLGYSSDGGKTVTDIALTDDGKILGSALIIKQDDVDGLSAALSAINGELTSKITRAEAESEIKQTADALNVRITGLDDDLQLITKSFHVGDDGLVIGETDNPIKLRLDNDTLQFLRDNVAELEITADGVVAKRLTVSTIMIGEVLIQADDNGDVIIA
ncbi:MAG: endopeptidase tail [Bacteriophage sp.]|nr:MAG: endopeptidase tail [Bacteriophage sp.]